MIREGIIKDIDGVIDALKNSLLYDAYFQDDEHTQKFIRDSIEKKELYLYETNDFQVAGFIRFDLNGMFSQFSLLRVLAVKYDFRNKGIGSELLDFYENIGFEKNNKIFLCVSDFNKNAKRLYERKGYVETGKISDLYKNGIDQYIMIKNKENKNYDF